MRVAEQALIDWQTNEKNHQGYELQEPNRNMTTGQEIWYTFWRKQVSGRQGNKNGQFLGPARILATETKRQGDGNTDSGQLSMVCPWQGL